MQKFLNSKFRSRIFLGTLVLCAGLFVTLGYSRHVEAATLSLISSAQNVSSGNIFSVKVLVAANGSAINSANGTINFPIDLLDVMSVSKSSSIFNLWVEEPRFSNGVGTINFDGGLPSPGYSGQSGEILTVVFKAKKSGTASIFFSDASVFANDGLGTQVLESKGVASVKIGASATEVPVVSTKSDNLPQRPIITSSTNPDEEAWYSNTTATLGWNVPSDTIAIQTLLSKNKNATPTVTYDGTVSQRTVNNLADGVWYFLVRYQNNVGWGPVASYKIQIDSTPPDKLTAVEKVNKGSSSSDCTASLLNGICNGSQFATDKHTLLLSSHDAGSGVDSYSIRVDNGPAKIISAASLTNGQYDLPVQTVGKHTVAISAYDEARNHSDVNISIVSSDITAPTISSDRAEIMRGDTLKIKGTSAYSNSPAQILVETSDGNQKIYDVTTDQDGNYSVETDPLSTSGKTSVWSKLVFTSGAESPISSKLTVRVLDTLIVKTSKSIIYGMSFIIPALGLIAVLIIMVYLGWHKFFGLRRKVRRESQSVINDTHKAFALFKDEMCDQLEKLEALKKDRDLNKKEEKIFNAMKKNVEDIDDFIEKKLKKMF